uniref:Glutathione peroxidase n=1 Tax=Albugo laibachii Nc14 TaxID=890382 RepID=F0WLJ9_9STRA|nr:unknown putative [Albugo laibachii Nc14]|eukprot:CCA22163.1 unknown putative [Albugo laibachii Nc14]
MWSRISALFFSPLVYAESQSAYDFHVKDIKGEPVHLLTYRKSPVWLVVNVASACGYADQNYKELQTLYTKYQDQGLVILAFPCNQFNSQESKSNEEILSFVQKRYGVTFPLFEKVHSLYRTDILTPSSADRFL